MGTCPQRFLRLWLWPRHPKVKVRGRSPKRGGATVQLACFNTGRPAARESFPFKLPAVLRTPASNPYAAYPFRGDLRRTNPQERLRPEYYKCVGRRGSSQRSSTTEGAVSHSVWPRPPDLIYLWLVSPKKQYSLLVYHRPMRSCFCFSLR